MPQSSFKPWNRRLGLACNPEEDDAVILENSNVHLAHLVIRHRPIRQILVNFPLQYPDEPRYSPSYSQAYIKWMHGFVNSPPEDQP